MDVSLRDFACSDSGNAQSSKTTASVGPILEASSAEPFSVPTLRFPARWTAADYSRVPSSGTVCTSVGESGALDRVDRSLLRRRPASAVHNPLTSEVFGGVSLEEANIWRETVSMSLQIFDRLESHTTALLSAIQKTSAELKGVQRAYDGMLKQKRRTTGEDFDAVERFDARCEASASGGSGDVDLGSQRNKRSRNTAKKPRVI